LFRFFINTVSFRRFVSRRHSLAMTFSFNQCGFLSGAFSSLSRSASASASRLAYASALTAASAS
jgi:hypothetical protein